jgi:hypothetical protein
VKPSTSFAGPLLALAIALGACAPSSIELPEPPMTDETMKIAAIYENPTGTLDTAHIDMVFDQANTRLQELHLTWLPDMVADVLIALQKRLSDGELSTDPGVVSKESNPPVNIAVTVNRTCKGWSDPPGPPDPDTNGTIELTAVIGGSELRRDLWGVATNCHGLVTASDGTTQMGFLDGTFIVQLRGALPRQPGDLMVLFLLSGSLEAGATNKMGSWDFLIENGQLEFRQSVADGDVIVTVGLTTLTLRGKNATFSCDLQSGGSASAGGVVGSRCRTD